MDFQVFMANPTPHWIRPLPPLDPKRSSQFQRLPEFIRIRPVQKKTLMVWTPCSTSFAYKMHPRRLCQAGSQNKHGRGYGFISRGLGGGGYNVDKGNKNQPCTQSANPLCTSPHRVRYSNRYSDASRGSDQGEACQPVYMLFLPGGCIVHQNASRQR